MNRMLILVLVAGLVLVLGGSAVYAVSPTPQALPSDGIIFGKALQSLDPGTGQIYPDGHWASKKRAH
ncbi:MAG: hypothetical protein HY393_03790 [Candidatus Diapherotrites archaeon]|nr:hypothetical protein [Candidatus Diapherotrites archaeon]